MTRRQELIYLLESHKNGMIDLEFFCSEFYRVYFNVEKDSDKIPLHEDKYMKELAMMCSRYTSKDINLMSFYSEKDMLSKMVETAQKNDADIVQCSFIYDFSGGKTFLPKGAFNRDIELSGDGLKKVYLRMMTGINMNHVCMKLIRTELIGDLRFETDLKTAEDLQFCIRLFGKVKKYCFINKAMYHYRRSNESLTGSGLSGKEKLRANRRVSIDMKKALAGWGMDNFLYRRLCELRPYIITASKIVRIFREKLFTQK